MAIKSFYFGDGKMYKKAISLFTLFFVPVFLSGCATTSDGPMPSDLSMRLKENEDEQQVLQKIGYQPNKIEMTSCGPTRSTTCKVYYYSGSGQTLLIFFVKNRVITSFKVPVESIPEDPNLIDASYATFEYVWLVVSWRVLNTRL